MKTIAEKIKTRYLKNSDAYDICERLHVDINQDWDNMETTYIFNDDSQLIFNSYNDILVINQ